MQKPKITIIDFFIRTIVKNLFFLTIFYSSYIMPTQPAINNNKDDILSKKTASEENVLLYVNIQKGSLYFNHNTLKITQGLQGIFLGITMWAVADFATCMVRNNLNFSTLLSIIRLRKKIRNIIVPDIIVFSLGLCIAYKLQKKINNILASYDLVLDSIQKKNEQEC